MISDLAYSSEIRIVIFQSVSKRQRDVVKLRVNYCKKMRVLNSRDYLMDAHQICTLCRRNIAI